MIPAARAVLLTAALTHVLHDGFSDALYVLLPLWATEFRLTLTGGRRPQGGLHRRHGALPDPRRAPRRALGRAPAAGGRAPRSRRSGTSRWRRRRAACSRSLALLLVAGPRLRSPASPVVVARLARLRDRTAAGGARDLQLRGRPRQDRGAGRPSRSRRASSAGAARAASTRCSASAAPLLIALALGRLRAGGPALADGGAPTLGAAAGASVTRAASRRWRRSA